MKIARGFWASKWRLWALREALVGRDLAITFGDLEGGLAAWHERLDRAGVAPGAVVAILGEGWRTLVPAFLALAERGAIVVPIVSASAEQVRDFLAIASVDFTVDARGDAATIAPLAPPPRHALTAALAARGQPGLILFSSGSTGAPKAILHDMGRMLAKYERPRPGGRLVCFLLPDHIGGVNTLFHALAYGGTVIALSERDPDSVCAAIARHRAEVLPTSPTFLNLLLVSGAHERHDLSSLKVITYGTELMPQTVLERVRATFPACDLRQTYGLSEVGILRSQSRPDGSLWIRVGGEGYETQIRDGILWVRAESAMLGYLNAPSAFDAEGWFNTQDMVEQDGEWLRFLGRRSEIINVGGQKVYPAEVESVLLRMEGVREATVRGEKNPLLGQAVVARVSLEGEEEARAFKDRMRAFCADKLAPYMIPVKVEVAAQAQHNARFKKIRNA
jgi:acyl-coenzyme A synthetase/AMP-(fatty) acid ligase